MSISRVQVNLTRKLSAKTPPIALPFPVSPILKLAQLSPGATFADAEPFIPKRWADLQVFGAHVVIGSLVELQRLANQVRLGLLDMSSLDRALVILTRFGSDPLNDLSRVALWQTFGVPIFELYLGLDQTLLASECEAHEGWHLAEGVTSTSLESGELVFEGAGNSGLRTGLRASIDRNPCPCGRTAPRVLEIGRLARFDEQFVAVSA